MIHLNHNGRFHGIGQGLFHSAQLTILGTNQPPFRYIYDCGSENSRSCTRGVDTYIASLPAKTRLDLLVLSHMHNDHVSGLDRLLHGLDGVKAAVLPYLYPWERAAVGGYALRRASGRGPRPPEWFFEFLERPAKYLVANGAEIVLFVRGNDGRPGEDEPPFDPKLTPEHPDEPSLGFEWNKVPVDPRTESDIRHSETVNRADEHSDQVHLITSRSVMRCPVWFFTFFNQAPDVRKVAVFRAHFERIVNGDPLGTVLKDNKRLERITRAYEKLFGKNRLNDTSLAVFSGKSISRYEQWLHSVHSTHRIRWEMHSRLGFIPSPRTQGAAIGFLFTGDLPVNKVWDEFSRKFRQDGTQQRFLLLSYQVPHHGSKHNWSIQQCSLHGPPVYIISAGRPNRYHHPSTKLVRALFERGRIVLRADQKTPIRYDTNFNVY